MNEWNDQMEAKVRGLEQRVAFLEGAVTALRERLSFAGDDAPIGRMSLSPDLREELEPSRVGTATPPPEHREGQQDQAPPAQCSVDTPCCDRREEYNGFGSDGPLLFTCPKRCDCHD